MTTKPATKENHQENRIKENNEVLHVSSNKLMKELQKEKKAIKKTESLLKPAEGEK